MPERFARNTRFLLNTFNYKQEALARGIGMSTSTFSRYMNGTRAKLEFSQYALTAECLIADICLSEQETEYFFELTGLGKPEGFDYSDFARLNKDRDLVKKLGADLLRIMKTRDFVATDDEEDIGGNTGGSKASNSGRKTGDSNKPRLKRKKLLTIAGICILVGALVFIVYAAFFSQPDVTLTITGSSALGEPDPLVTGTVTVSRGSPEDYAITMALISPTDGRMYAPKPSSTYPTVPVTLTDERGVGNFTCVFSAGYADSDARELYIYVIPVEFVPDRDTERTEKAAAVWVKYVRD